MMNNYLSKISKLGLAVAITAASISTANATSYTAVASGNFSSNATWSGGVAPTVILAGDDIHIPTGLTVTLDNNISFNVAATLDVDGTLTSSVNPTAVIMTAGSLMGSGSILVDSMALALSSGITYTGDIVAQKMSTAATTFSSTADVTVNGKLWVIAGATSITDGNFMMGSGSTIVIKNGTLTLAGTGTIDLTSNYNVEYQGSSATTGVEITGNSLQNVKINLTAGAVTLNDDIEINGILTLQSGNLILDNNDLTIGADGDLSAMTGGTINSTSGSDITIMSTNGLSGNLTFGNGNNSVNNLTIDLGNASANVALGSDVEVNGTLTLNDGTFSLNNNDLMFTGNGDFAVAGAGNIVSTSGSDITITSNGNFSGGLRFSSTGNVVNDLTIDMGSNTSYARLGTDLHVAGTLMLDGGMIHVEDNNLVINAGGMISGGSEDSYVITEDGGKLTINLAANASEMFHVGTMNNYSPAVVAANTGSVTSDISVNAIADVYADGTTGTDLSAAQSVVDGTWNITSSATTGIDLDLQLMWNASMEVNGFDRTNAYISHYTNSMWDITATSSATASGNLYVMNRDNVTSLSPFTVADNDATLGVPNTVSRNVAIAVYPNPATNVVNFTSDKQVSDIVVYDVTGRVVMSMNAQGNSFDISELTAGNYTIQLSGEDFKATQQIIKR